MSRRRRAGACPEEPLSSATKAGGEPSGESRTARRQVQETFGPEPPWTERSAQREWKRLSRERSGVDEAELDDPPLAAELGEHDVHGPADLGEIARLLRDAHGTDPALEPQRPRLHPLDRKGVLDPVLVRNVVRVEGRRLRHLVVQELTEPFRAWKLTSSLCAALDRVRPLVAGDVALLVQPGGELLRYRPGSSQQLLARHHLPHHEVAEELAEVLDDLLRAEEPRERLLVAAVERLPPALLLETGERLVGVSVQRARSEEHT